MENIEPDFCRDITGFTAGKIESIFYGSQFYDKDSKEPESLLPLNFLESVNYRSQDLGRLAGVDYAEGFTERYLAVNSLGFDLNFLIF
jgi:hypothetical protein